MKRSSYLCLALITIAATAAQALWVPPSDRIPTSRLIENLQAQLAKSPKDANLLARLGRIYSLRYSLGDTEVDVQKERDSDNFQLYAHGNGYPSTRHGMEGEAIVARIGDLHQAMDYYQRAVAIEPDEAYIWLGLGYTCDEMSHAAAFLAWPVGDDSEAQQVRDTVRLAWENKALDAYGRAMGTAPRLTGGFLTPPVELEAARYIRKILDERKKKSREEKNLLSNAQELVRQAATLPRMVTPIIFSLDAPRPVQQLLAPETHVGFDLDGTESGKQWPWVQPDTAILVWDGDGQGDVPSGRELIGSVTWWLFWENGYAVLRALDNDEDGWLRASELTGLAAWRDRNSNGIADQGEVEPLLTLGIQGLAVTVTGFTSGMPMNLRGLEMSDGTFLPTYDWIVSPVE
tara:strand:+ start:999 stop:2207 length:1209 start_codon:yes stop_codon:yes gene_type:complete